jgi:hypothetical protein
MKELEQYLESLRVYNNHNLSFKVDQHELKLGGAIKWLLIDVKTLNYWITITPDIKELSLSGLPITKQVMSKLVEFLEINTSIENLDLSKTSIDDEKAAILWKALSKNTTIKHLDLTKNAICSQGSLLLKALRNNKNLISLYLHDNPMESEQLEEILADISFNPSLLYISLYQNGVEKSNNYFVIKEIIHKLPKLFEISDYTLFKKAVSEILNYAAGIEYMLNENIEHISRKNKTREVDLNEKESKKSLMLVDVLKKLFPDNITHDFKNFDKVLPALSSSIYLTLVVEGIIREREGIFKQALEDTISEVVSAVKGITIEPAAERPVKRIKLLLDLANSEKELETLSLQYVNEVIKKNLFNCICDLINYQQIHIINILSKITYNILEADFEGKNFVNNPLGLKKIVNGIYDEYIERSNINNVLDDLQNINPQPKNKEEILAKIYFHIAEMQSKVKGDSHYEMDDKILISDNAIFEDGQTLYKLFADLRKDYYKSYYDRLTSFSSSQAYKGQNKSNSSVESSLINEVKEIHANTDVTDDIVTKDLTGHDSSLHD